MESLVIEPYAQRKAYLMLGSGLEPNYYMMPIKYRKDDIKKFYK